MISLLHYYFIIRLICLCCICISSIFCWWLFIIHLSPRIHILIRKWNTKITYISELINSSGGNCHWHWIAPSLLCVWHVNQQTHLYAIKQKEIQSLSCILLTIVVYLDFEHLKVCICFTSKIILSGIVYGSRLHCSQLTTLTVIATNVIEFQAMRFYLLWLLETWSSLVQKIWLSYISAVIK